MTSWTRGKEEIERIMAGVWWGTSCNGSIFDRCANCNETHNANPIILYVLVLIRGYSISRVSPKSTTRATLQ
jgi:hypothetical protein